MKRSYLLSGSAAVALFLAGAVSASAADIVAPEPEPMLYDWTGFYIGGHAGAGALGTDGVWANDDTNSQIDLGALGGEIGGVFGGQVGVNWQAGNIVFGVEGDITWIGELDRSRVEIDEIEDPDDTTAMRLENDFLASVRGRIGWADDNVLFYVTGGVAWYEGEISLNEHGCNNLGGDNCSLDVSDTGGVVGAGLEWGATQNITLRAEGLYYFFDNKECLEEGCDGPNRIAGADSDDFFKLDDALVARVGINFLFNPFN